MAADASIRGHVPLIFISTNPHKVGADSADYADEPIVRLFGSAFVTLRDHRNGNNFGVQTFPWTVANDGIQRLLIGTAEGRADYIARCRDQTEILAV